MQNNVRKPNLLQGTGLAAAMLILAGAIATAIHPAATEEGSLDRKPPHAVESTTASLN